MVILGCPGRRLLVLIAVIGLMAALLGSRTAVRQAQGQSPQRFDLLKTIRVQLNDAVEINWSADRRTVLHLHGYNIETIVDAGEPQTMSFTARATGRFPIEAHGARHTVVIHLEVHPR